MRYPRSSYKALFVALILLVASLACRESTAPTRATLPTFSIGGDVDALLGHTLVPFTTAVNEWSSKGLANLIATSYTCTQGSLQETGLRVEEAVQKLKAINQLQSM